MWDVLKRHQPMIATFDTTVTGHPIRGWLGDTNREGALGFTAENIYCGCWLATGRCRFLCGLFVYCLYICAVMISREETVCNYHCKVENNAFAANSGTGLTL